MRKMNTAGVTGLFLCFVAVLIGVAANGGISSIINYLHIPSFIVTVGGAMFAVLATADSFADYIDGLSVPIIKTRDDKIIVFDDNMGTGTKTEVLQNSTINDLQETTIFTLESMLTALTNINGFNKRIILNVYPLMLPILSNETIQYINNKNMLYIKMIKEIIDKYPNLNISLSSVNTNLLQEMKRRIINHNLGLIVDVDNPIYLDVDFYILKPIMLDEVIINQELDRGHEVIVSVTSGDDLSLTYIFFKENKNKVRDEILLKLTFMTGYPQVLNSTLNN